MCQISLRNPPVLQPGYHGNRSRHLTLSFRTSIDAGSNESSSTRTTSEAKSSSRSSKRTLSLCSWASIPLACRATAPAKSERERPSERYASSSTAAFPKPTDLNLDFADDDAQLPRHILLNPILGPEAITGSSRMQPPRFCAFALAGAVVCSVRRHAANGERSRAVCGGAEATSIVELIDASEMKPTFGTAAVGRFLKMPTEI